MEITQGIEEKSKESASNVDLYFHEIGTIVETFYGLILQVANSDVLYVLNCVDFSEKQQMMKLIQENAAKFLEHQIPIQTQNPFEFLEKDLSEDSLQSFWKTYECLK